MKSIKIISIIASMLLITGCGAGIESSIEQEHDGYFSQGELSIMITDFAAEMENVSEITAEIEAVSVHSAEGWVNLDLVNDEFNLLELNSKSQNKLLASAKLDAGAYNKIRLEFDEVIIHEKDGDKVEAHLPSTLFEADVKTNVQADAKAAAIIDILADNSLYVEDETQVDAEYLFAPVVNVKTYSNANVEVDSNDYVEISGGKKDANLVLGMDADGKVRSNFRINPDAKFSIDWTGSVQMESLTNAGLRVVLNGKSELISTGVIDLSVGSTTTSKSSTETGFSNEGAKNDESKQSEADNSSEANIKLDNSTSLGTEKINTSGSLETSSKSEVDTSILNDTVNSEVNVGADAALKVDF